MMEADTRQETLPVIHLALILLIAVLLLGLAVVGIEGLYYRQSRQERLHLENVASEELQQQLNQAEKRLSEPALKKAIDQILQEPVGPPVGPPAYRRQVRRRIAGLSGPLASTPAPPDRWRPRRPPWTAGVIAGLSAPPGVAPVAPVAPIPAGLVMPPRGSTFAYPTDRLLGVLTAVSLFFLVLIVTLTVYFLVRYRSRDRGVVMASGPTFDLPLELLWTGVPVAIVLGLFIAGFRGFLTQRTPPANALEIQGLARKWSWSFVYPNGATDPELHVPPGRPILLTLESADVIHDLYIPAFRVHHDIVPARVNWLWFEATLAGRYPLFCTQYCGDGHSSMISAVVVHPSLASYEAWVREAADLWHGPDGKERSAVEVGRLLTRSLGCLACHTLDGTPGTGPTWQGLWGSRVRLQNGQEVTADRGYLRESILQPGAKIVAGYQDLMPSYAGRVDERKLGALEAYIASLRAGG